MSSITKKTQLQEWEMEELNVNEIAELSDAILAWCGFACSGKGEPAD